MARQRRPHSFRGAGSGSYHGRAELTVSSLRSPPHAWRISRARKGERSRCGIPAAAPSRGSWGTSVATIATTAAPEQPAASSAALTGWVLFDWAAQPYYTLILTFLFAPYFANAVVGDADVRASDLGLRRCRRRHPDCHRQSAARRDGRWPRPAQAVDRAVLPFHGRWHGGLVDRRAGRHGTNAVVVVVAFVVATVAAEFTTVFTNAIMPTLVPPSSIGRLSGIGWGVGYAGGLVSLALMAGLVVTNPATGKTLLGLDPVLSLDTAAREGDRLVGPFSAAWYLVFMLPFFLFVPDARPRAGCEHRPAIGFCRALVHFARAAQPSRHVDVSDRACDLRRWPCRQSSRSAASMVRAYSAGRRSSSACSVSSSR